QFDFGITDVVPLASASLATDFGIPGLNLHTAPGSALNVNLNISFAFGFGYSKEDGFYFDTMAASHLLGFNSNHALTIGLDVNIQNLDVMGQLGFLDVHITPGQNTAPFGGASFSIDVKNPVGNNNRLTLAELEQANLGDLFTTSFQANIDLGLHLE